MPPQNFLHRAARSRRPEGKERGLELFTPEMLSALAAIVVIDIVLAGDNAIVIALAARSLPRELQRRAIFWGTGGAIIVRIAMTAAVVWLLQVPGLMLAGGLVLLWIALKLLAPNDAGEDHEVRSGTGFWGALRTIVIADAAMGLDNVLAVAGAAQGSFMLVVMGLLISIPIVVWGSTLVLSWIQRFPMIIYIGGGVLAWTAAKMITGEPMIQSSLAGQPSAQAAIYVVIVVGVLLTGYLRNRRAERRLARS
jgi:YjbE family integral membrane protein